MVATGFMCSFVFAWYARTGPYGRVAGISTSHRWIGVGILLAVIGMALALYVEPIDRWRVRLYYYFGAVALIAVGSGAILFTRFSPYDEGLAVLGTTLIFAGFGLATYGGSFRQWRRRMGYTVVGVTALSAGAFAVFAIFLAVAMGMAQAASTADVSWMFIVIGMIAVPTIVVAGWAFKKAWRTPPRG
jgi:hypothetical protein